MLQRIANGTLRSAGREPLNKLMNMYLNDALPKYSSEVSSHEPAGRYGAHSLRHASSQLVQKGSSPSHSQPHRSKAPSYPSSNTVCFPAAQVLCLGVFEPIELTDLHHNAIPCTLRVSRDDCQHVRTPSAVSHCSWFTVIKEMTRDDVYLTKPKESQISHAYSTSLQMLVRR